jgi:hypothetical protein
MDLSQLKSLGEIAGIGGIALGAVVLLLRPLIGTIAGLPKDARSGPVKLIAIGCFVIGVLGIAAWTMGGQLKGSQVLTTHGRNSPAVTSDRDVTISIIAGEKAGNEVAPTPSPPSGTK